MKKSIVSAVLAVGLSAIAHGGWQVEVLGASAKPAAGVESIFVERVLDGDTIVVRGVRERIRLASVDAPETEHPGKVGQRFAGQSARWLAAEIERKPGVSMQCVDQDQYGRPVCNVFRDEHFVNKELVRAGLAWANTAQRRYLRDRDILVVQEEARTARRGLWADASPVEPWRWRRECWEQRKCGAEQGSP